MVCVRVTVWLQLALPRTKTSKVLLMVNRYKWSQVHMPTGPVLEYMSVHLYRKMSLL